MSPRAFLSFLLAASFALTPARAERRPEARLIQTAARYCRTAAATLGRGDLAKARALYWKALEHVSGFPDAHLGIGHVALAEGRFEEALEEYQKARAGYVELYDALLDVLQRRYSEAQEEIRQIRNTLSSSEAKSQGSGLDSDRRPSTSLRPTESGSAMEVATLERRLRELELVEPPQPTGTREPPAEFDFHIGNAQFRLGRYGESQKSWEACAAKKPDLAVVHNNLAVLYWKQGRFEDAQKSLSRAEQLGFAVNPKFKEDLGRAAGPKR